MFYIDENEKLEDLKEIAQDNNLESEVAQWLLNESENGSYEQIEDVLSDLLQHGCISGMVSHLIYYNDTIAFYNKYKSEINELLSNMIDETGMSVNELFGDNWDKSDPLAQDTMNQNLLAWFAFEETAHRLASKLDIEI